MSYRSKRTRELLMKDDMSQEPKKPAASPGALRPPELGGKWGPFAPPNSRASHPTIEKNPSPSTNKTLQPQPKAAQSSPIWRTLPGGSSQVKPSFVQSRISSLDKSLRDKNPLTQSSQQRNPPTLLHKNPSSTSSDSPTDPTSTISHAAHDVIPKMLRKTVPSASSKPLKDPSSTISSAAHDINPTAMLRKTQFSTSSKPLKDPSSTISPAAHDINPTTMIRKTPFSTSSKPLKDPSSTISPAAHDINPTTMLHKNPSSTSSDSPTDPASTISHAAHDVIPKMLRKTVPSASSKPLKDPSSTISPNTHDINPTVMLRKTPFSASSKPLKDPSSTISPAAQPTPSTKNSSVASEDETLDQGCGKQIGSNTLKSFRPRRHSLLPDWPDDTKFDEKEEVLTIDREGKYQMVSGSIQPPDVWNANGVKYFVTFNEFCQPLRKGGHILIKFLGDVAKNERFCPIREHNWHHVKSKLKADIIQLIRAHFVIPVGDNYDFGALKRTGKSWRQYRYALKKMFFHPMKKTKEEIYNRVPSGHPCDSWMELVDYWYSPKGQELSGYGRDARALHNHVHTSGSTSYADVRADFEDTNGREPSELELFNLTHRRKDGSFVKDTITADFVDDVEAEVEWEMTVHPSSSKSRVDFENKAFNHLMYGGEIPERPVNYGFGVKPSDLFGVRGILRKEGFTCGENKSMEMENVKAVMSRLNTKNEVLEKQNEVLQTKYDENNQLLKLMTAQFSQVIDAMRNGKASNEFLDLTSSILHMASPQDFVRQEALEMLQNALEGSGGNGASAVYSDAFRLIMRVGLGDKSFIIRIAAARCLKTFASIGGPGLGVSELENSSTYCVKALEDPIASVRDAFAEALGTLLALGMNPEAQVRDFSNNNGGTESGNVPSSSNIPS